MQVIRACASVFASVVFVALTAIPAGAWHGSGNITAIAVNPLTPTTLYAASPDRGVFKSTDGGVTWSSTGLTNAFVTALAIDPQSPSTLYAGTQDGGVSKSIDEGANWSATGLTNGSVSVLAIDSVTPATLYAVHSNGLLKSTDGGATWNVILANADNRPDGYFWNVAALVVDPLIPSTVYVGTVYADFVTEYSEMWKSTDGSASWSVISEPLHPLAIERRTDPLAPTTLYAEAVSYFDGCHGVFKSSDGGVSWPATGLIDTPDVGVCVADLQIDPVSPATLYAASAYAGFSGVSRSLDGGATWSAANAGLTDTLVTFGLPPVVSAIAIDPVTATILYAATAAGVFKSTNGGASWSPTGLFQHSPLVSVSLSPTSVTGGSASTGTVSLLTPAPEGGAVVTLASSNTAVATVPTTVTVPAGATSATFTISTSPVTANTGVTISAAFDDATRSAVLAVYAPTAPPTLLYIFLPIATGGTPSTGLMYLSAPAPAGGAAVELSSSNPAIATVPASVTVPAGTTYAYFTISTISVAAPTSVTISGAYGGVTKSAELTVTPPSLSSLSLNPTSVPGGTPSTGTVTLNAAAPEGGVTVMLRSYSTVATVPAGVTVAAGATSASFTVSTSPVYAAPIGFEIAGTYGGLTASARLTVTPATTATLYSLSLNDASVPGGAPLAGTVTLTAVAPAGGAVVTLSSSNPVVATVPASVTVAAGATSASFTGSTAACISTAATISGTYEGVTRSAGLTVTPPATTDTVAIQQADYFANKRELRVAAKSTSSTATLRVFVTSTGDLIGTLTKGGDGRYSGQFTWPVNPQNIEVRSSFCGSATKAVTPK